MSHLVAATAAQEDQTGQMDRALLRGLAWTGGSRWLTQLLTWPATFLVARMLSPDDYGTIAMASVQIRVLSLVIEAGLSSAVVVQSELAKEEYEQIHTLSLLMGAAALVVCGVLAVPLSRFYSAPQLTSVILVLGAVLVVDALRAIPTGLLRKRLRFKALAGVDIVRAVVDAGTGLALAWLGFGHWALVMQFVAGSLIATVLVLLLSPIHFRMPRLRELHGTVKLGGHFALGSIAWYVYISADTVIAGRLLGSAALGAYSFAGMLAHLPADRIAAAVTRVAPSMFAAVRSDQAGLRRYFSSLVAGLAGVILPCLVGLALLADEFVEIFLGTQWGAVVVPLQLLVAFAAVKTLVDLAASLLSSVGQVQHTAAISVASALVLPPAFFLFGERWGVVGLAVTWLTIYPLLQLPILVRAMRVTGMCARDLISILVPATAGCTAMAAGVVAVRTILMQAGWSSGPRFTACVVAGVLVYAALAALLQWKTLSGLMTVVRSHRIVPTPA